MGEIKINTNDSNEFIILWKCSVAIYIIKNISFKTCSNFENKVKDIKRDIEILKKEFLVSNDKEHYDNLMYALNNYSKNFYRYFKSYDLIVDKILEDDFQREDLIKIMNSYINLKDITRDEKFYLFESKKLLSYLDQDYLEMLKEIVLEFYEDKFEICDLQEIEIRTYNYLKANIGFSNIIRNSSEKNIEENRLIEVLEKSEIYLNENLSNILDNIIEKNYDELINIIDSNLNKYSEDRLLFYNSSYDAAVNFLNNLGNNVILNNKLFERVVNEGFFNPIRKENIKGLNIFDLKNFKNNKIECIKMYSYKNNSQCLNIDEVIFVNQVPVALLFKKTDSLRNMYENVMDLVDIFPEIFTFIQKIIIYEDSKIFIGSIFDDIDDYKEFTYSQKSFELEKFITKMFFKNHGLSDEANKIGLSSIMDVFLEEDSKTITNILNYYINKFSNLNYNYSTYEYANCFIYEIKKHYSLNKQSIFKKAFKNEEGIQNNNVRIIDGLNYSKNHMDLLLNYNLIISDLNIKLDGIFFVNYIPTLIYLEAENNPKNILKRLKCLSDKKTSYFLNKLIIKYNENFYYGSLHEDFEEFEDLTNCLIKRNNLSVETILDYKDLFLDLILEKFSFSDLRKNENYKLIDNNFSMNNIKSNRKEYSDDKGKLHIDYLDLLNDEDDLDLDDLIDDGEFKEFTEIANFKYNNEYVENIIDNDSKEDKKLLILANENLVYMYANIYYKIYKPRCLDIDDLAQLGREGLLKAAERFDFSFGTSFSTYAVPWIRQSITRGIQDMGDIVRIPTHMYEKINKLTRLEKKSELLYGRVNDDYILEEMDEKIEKIKNYRLVRYKFLRTPSLETEVGEDGDAVLKDFIEDPEVNIEKEYEIKNLKVLIDRELNKLDDREKTIIKKRFGLDGNSPMTLEDIGLEFGVSRERIRQIENKVLEKLKYNRTIKECKNFIWIV